MKIYRDLKGVIDTAYGDGKIDGKREAAKILKEKGIATDVIIKATGLSKDEINSL